MTFILEWYQLCIHTHTYTYTYTYTCTCTYAYIAYTYTYTPTYVYFWNAKTHVHNLIAYISAQGTVVKWPEAALFIREVINTPCSTQRWHVSK